MRLCCGILVPAHGERFWHLGRSLLKFCWPLPVFPARNLSKAYELQFSRLRAKSGSFRMAVPCLADTVRRLRERRKGPRRVRLCKHIRRRYQFHWRRPVRFCSIECQLPNHRFESGTPAIGLLGTITGTWTLGTINGFTAPVTGSGTLSISDGSGHSLTGTLSWANTDEVGATGALNYLAGANLTAFSYTGSNPALITLANQGSAVDVLTFQFPQAESLADLKAGGLSSSFSGSINPAAAPEPRTIALGVIGASVFLCRKRK